MASYKKKEEERKQRREAMAKKYPMQNPRTNTAAIVTNRNVEGWESEVWKSGSKLKAESAVNRNPTQPLKGTNYPLFTNGQSGQYKPKDSGSVKSAQIRKAYQTTEERAYKIKSADGWRKYQIDEAEKRRREKEPSYQRWIAQFGEDAFDAALYRPGKNWSESAVNDFGFYYNEDKQKAYRYAATLNKGYQQIDEAFGRQLGGLEGKRAEAGLETANAVTDWLKRLDLGEKLKGAWEHQGEALNSYGDAMKRRDEKTADAAKSLWDWHQTNATTLANARAAQTKAQTEGIREIANKSWDYVESNIGIINNATQSNQMGAGIYGFLQSAASDEQNEIEKVDAQRKELAESVTDNAWSMIGGFVGARAANLLQPLDLAKSAWEGGAFGHVDLSGGEFYQIKDTIDNAISQKLGEALPKIDENVPFIGGMGVDDLYDIIVGEVNSSFSLKMPKGILHKGISAISENFHAALEEAKRGGAKDKTALNYATIKSLGTGISEILDAVEIKKLNIMDPDDVFAEIITKGLKSGAIEIVKDGLGNSLKSRENWSENGQQNQVVESDETADAWRQGFLGEVLSSSAPEVIDATKKIIKKIQAQK